MQSNKNKKNLVNHVAGSQGEDLERRHLIWGPDAHIWRTALANDLGRLTQGVGTRMKHGKNKMLFMHPKSISKEKKATHVRLVSDTRPLKAEVNRARSTIGRDRLPFDGSTAATPSTLTTAKVRLNSTTSDPDAQCMTLDTKDYFYGTPMDKHEHGFIPLDLAPEEIINQHDLIKLASNGKALWLCWF